MTTQNVTQFDVDRSLIFVFAFEKEAPYGIKIEFNKYQQDRIIELISMHSSKLYSNNSEKQKLFNLKGLIESSQRFNAKRYHGRKAYNEVLYNQESQHVRYDTLIKKVKKNEPLTCQQFQGLCYSMIVDIDKEHPTPNDKSITHLLAEAGKTLFDLDKLTADELDNLVKQKSKRIVDLIEMSSRNNWSQDSDPS